MSKVKRKKKAAVKAERRQERRATNSTYRAKKWTEEHGQAPRPRSEMPPGEKT